MKGAVPEGAGLCSLALSPTRLREPALSPACPRASTLLPTRLREWWAWLVLTLLVTLSSAGLVQKYSGLAGVAVYGIAVALVLLGARWMGQRWAGLLERCFAMWLVLAGLLLAAGYLLANPLEERRGPVNSSDRDEGLELAVTRMAAGETPYYPQNKVAGPLSVLPGGILLAAPFVALGDVGYQNVFWLVVLMGALARWCGLRMPALVLPAVLLLASPSMLHEFVSGGDLIANGIYVAVLLGACFRAWRTAQGTVVWWRWTATVLLGIALASRPNFLLLLPLLGGVLWNTSGWRTAVRVTTVVGLVSLAVILPFHLHDPAGFTPLVARKKLAVVDHVLPWAGTAMIGITVLASLAGAAVLWLRGGKEPLPALCRACAWVTLCPIICAVVMRSWLCGALDFGFLLERFGVMYLGFTAVGWGWQWLGGRSDAAQAA